MFSTFLVTSSDEFQRAARLELRRYDPKLQPGEVLALGLFLVTSNLSEENFASAVAQDPPIYARHLFPVQATILLDRTKADLDRLAAAVAILPRLKTLGSETSFSVQARLVADEEGKTLSLYTSFAIKERLAALITQTTGASENIREPKEILSVVCAGERAYCGLSPAEFNLSSWPGGMRRLAKLPEQISRAELKLQEALEVFGVTLPLRGKALDLGAAPGGWTRLLLAAGLHVTAIDPAELDRRLVNAANLTHYLGYAQSFLETALSDKRQRGAYVVIVSDLRMDATLAARLLIDYTPLLAENGFAIATLKLPHETSRLKPAFLAKQALQTLGETYSTVRARQLFHNRQEITLFLRKDVSTGWRD